MSTAKSVAAQKISGNNNILSISVRSIVLLCVTMERVLTRTSMLMGPPMAILSRSGVCTTTKSEKRSMSTSIMTADWPTIASFSYKSARN